MKGSPESFFVQVLVMDLGDSDKEFQREATVVDNKTFKLRPSVLISVFLAGSGGGSG